MNLCNGFKYDHSLNALNIHPSGCDVLMSIKYLAFLQKTTMVRDSHKQGKCPEETEECGDSLLDYNQVFTQEWHLVIKLLDRVLLFVFVTFFTVLKAMFYTNVYQVSSLKWNTQSKNLTENIITNYCQIWLLNVRTMLVLTSDCFRYLTLGSEVFVVDCRLFLP